LAKRILITGGTGFIGQHLVARLIASNYPVHILSRRNLNGPTNKSCRYYTGDLLEFNQIKPAVKDVNVVYHLAVTTNPGSSNSKILYDAHTNIIGTLNLLHAASEAGVERVIFVSSGGSIYGKTDDRPILESHSTDPISAHGVSKLSIEKYLEVFHRLYGMEYRIARGANPYGAGQDPYRGQGFIPYGLAQLAQGKEIAIWGDGSIVRDFFHVGDFVDALVLMLDDCSPYRLYNVGSGQGTSLNELIGMFKSITGITPIVKYNSGREADVPYNCLDITRIKQNLNWEPMISMEEGLQRTWTWIRTRIAEKMM
jgi:UDP-glucose 4-epimerase